MSSIMERLKNRAIQKKRLRFNEAQSLYEAGCENPFRLMACATEIREHFKGKRISLCSIVNAKSGICPEDCKFCAQSAHYHTGAPVYDLIPSGEIIQKAQDAKEWGAHYFSIVTSGTSITHEEEWTEIYKAVNGIHQMGIHPCASLGLLDTDKATGLKKAGLYRYHHNLETARSFFHHICSTHAYEEDIHTIRAAKAAGLSICSGGIIGLGEQMEHRIELAFTLQELDVDSVPLNILTPIPGTPLENVLPLPPIEILITIALYRFILPDKDIKLCGGKEKNLRQLLPLAIVAGCNSLMTGNYLTTLGRDASYDREMIQDLGLIAEEI